MKVYIALFGMLIGAASYTVEAQSQDASSWSTGTRGNPSSLASGSTSSRGIGAFGTGQMQPSGFTCQQELDDGGQVIVNCCSVTNGPNDDHKNVCVKK